MVILRIIRWQVFCRECLNLSCFIELVGFPGGAVVKNLPTNAEDARDMGLIPEMGRSSGGGNGNLLQYSCLENSMDRRAQWSTVNGVAKNQTRLSAHR